MTRLGTRARCPKLESLHLLPPGVLACAHMAGDRDTVAKSTSTRILNTCNFTAVGLELRFIPAVRGERSLRIAFRRPRTFSLSPRILGDARESPTHTLHLSSLPHLSGVVSLE